MQQTELIHGKYKESPESKEEEECQEDYRTNYGLYYSLLWPQMNFLSSARRPSSSIEKKTKAASLPAPR